MIADFLRGNAPETLQADILVIGAGTLGLPVATLLARRYSRRVLCLESGSVQQSEDTHPLNEVVQSGTPYLGADHGRFRCLGGTSTRWGGAMIPFQQADLMSGNWPISSDDLAPYISEAESLFGLGAGPYSDPAFPISLGADFINRMAKWPPFPRRNVFNLLGKEATDSTNLRIWTNATAVQIALNADGVTVVAAAPNGRRMSISAKRVIVAAGAIETTRLALLIDRQNNGIVSARTPHLGRWFADHVSVPFAEICAHKTATLNKILGFRFASRGAMRNIRFELAGDSAVRQTLPPSFIHIGFASEQQGGFDALRRIYRFVQQRRIPSATTIVELVRHLPWLVRAMTWRLFRKRLLFPDAARLVAHLVIEQAADSDNRIELSASRSDIHGVPLPQIHWRVGRRDIEQAGYLADLFEQAWNDSCFGQLGALTRYDEGAVAANLLDSGGIYHPTGSTRMGQTEAEGAVDRDLRLFGAPQVQLLSTSALPSGGGANPTMMALLLALRCVDQHDRAATG
jgi:choline dehydrogenase-like flavoprotein